MSSNPRYKAFKPPRPAGATQDASATSASTSARRPARQVTPSATDPFRLSSSAPEVDSPAPSPSSDGDDNGERSDVAAKESTSFSSRDVEPAIPAQLLGRLVHEHFQHADTRITAEAMGVFAKYVEVFAMEALGRANEEREEAARAGEDVDTSFLEVRRYSPGRIEKADRRQVEDLEKLAPQLLLDF